MICLINYEIGNLRSVQKVFNHLKTPVKIASLPNDITRASKLVLPGVGHFAKAVRNLKQIFLWDVIQEAVLVKKIPILGICLGMQLMAKSSEEGNAEGFGWFDAKVVRFRVSDKLKYKVPHMGWNTISMHKSSGILSGLPETPEFYFVHSYHAVSNSEDEVLALTRYEYEFVSALEKENMIGVQFHPEKSHSAGEKIISNFIKL